MSNTGLAHLGPRGWVNELTEHHSGVIGAAPPITWAWCLSGGGAKGDFEAGAIAYLLDPVRTNPDAPAGRKPSVICGSSVGAINAIAAAEASLSARSKVIESWLTLREPADLFTVGPWADAISGLQSFEDNNIDVKRMVMSMLSGGSPVGGLLQSIQLDLFERITLSAIATVFGGLVFNYVLEEIEDLVDDIATAVSIVAEARSVFSLEPLRRRLESRIDPDAIEAAGTALRLVSMCLEDGARQYVDLDGTMIVERDGSRAVTRLVTASRELAIMDATLASAGIPGIFPAVVFTTEDGHTHTSVDGGVRDVLPLRAAFDYFDNHTPVGNRRAVIAISASPTAITPETYASDEMPGSFAAASLAKVAQRSLDLVFNEVEGEDLEDLPSDTFLFVHIKPDFAVHGTLAVDPGLVLISMAYGWMCAHDLLAPVIQESDYPWLRHNTNEIIRKRRRAWHLERQWTADGATPGLHWPRAAIIEIRNLKRDIAHHVEERRAFFAAHGYIGDGLPEFSLPDYSNPVEDWWLNWERHGPLTGPDSWVHPYDSHPRRWSNPFQQCETTTDAGHPETLPAESPPVVAVP